MSPLSGRGDMARRVSFAVGVFEVDRVNCRVYNESALVRSAYPLVRLFSTRPKPTGRVGAAAGERDATRRVDNLAMNDLMNNILSYIIHSRRECVRGRPPPPLAPPPSSVREPSHWQPRPLRPTPFDSVQVDRASESTERLT